MAKVYEGHLLGEGMRFGLVVGRFNEFITNRLLSGALDALKRHGVAEKDMEIAWVPGAFEVPLVARKMIEKQRFNAIICLGAVIRGATPHFDMVANEATKGIAQVAMHTDIPVIFGVLTTDSIEQALERAGTKSGNKGWDAALTAIEMMNLHKMIQ